MKLRKAYSTEGGLVFHLDVVAPDSRRGDTILNRQFGARAYVSLRMKCRHVNPLVGARYELFWCGIADRALQIAFPNQIKRIDDAIWLISRQGAGGAVKLLAGMETFERLFQIALSGVDPHECSGILAEPGTPPPSVKVGQIAGAPKD